MSSVIPYVDVGLDRVALDGINSPVPCRRQEVECLFARYHKELVRRCNQQLRNLDDAEDAAQEAELRAFRAFHNFKGDSSFRTWLFAIADNCCRTFAMQRGRYLIPEDIEVLVESRDDHQAADSNRGIDNLRLAGQALAAMSDSNRETVRLRYFYDLSIEEIARSQAIGQSAVKMRLQRGLQQCAERLAA